jgi:hypothetical protein
VQGRRTTGAVLYAVAAALLVVGALWWVRAAPDVGADPQVVTWRAAVQRLLPDRVDQLAAGTVTVRAEGAQEVEAATRPGRYFLFYLCAGQGQVRISSSSTGSAAGTSVDCTDPPQVQSLTIGLADRFSLSIMAASPSTVVFRWQLIIASR